MHPKAMLRGGQIYPYLSMSVIETNCLAVSMEGFLILSE